VVEVFKDDGVSGATFSRVGRPDFYKLLDVVAGKPDFDVLIVTEQSRIGRDTVRTLNAILTIREAGVRIFESRSGREITLDTDSDEIQEMVRAWSSSNERRKARERVAPRLRERAKDGFVPGGRVFGYLVGQRDASGKARFVPDEREADAVRRLFSLVSSGRGFQATARILAEEKQPSPRGRGWTMKGVKRIVERELYRGRLIYGRTKVEWRGGASKQVAAKNPIVTEVPAARIVPDELWNAAHARIARTAKAVAKPDGGARPSTGLAAKLLLSGFTICGRCHGPMTVLNFHSTAGAPAQRFLVCSNYHHRGSNGETVVGGRHCDSGARLRYMTLETRIVESFSQDHVVEMVNKFYDAEKARRAPDAVRAERVALEGEVKRLNQEMSNLADAVSKTGGSIDILVTKLQAAQAARDAAQAKLDATPEPTDLDWTPDWLLEQAESEGTWINRADHPGREFDLDLSNMLVSDVDRARRFLDAFLRGQRIILTPRSDGFDYAVTGDLGVLTGYLLDARRGSRNLHNPAPSSGSRCPRTNGPPPSCVQGRGRESCAPPQGRDRRAAPSIPSDRQTAQ